MNFHEAVGLVILTLVALALGLGGLWLILRVTGLWVILRGRRHGD